MSLDYVEISFLNALTKSASIAEKCYLVARYFGNEDEILFWTLALWALAQFSKKLPVIKTISSKEEEEDTSSLPPKEPKSPTNPPKSPVKSVHSRYFLPLF